MITEFPLLIFTVLVSIAAGAYVGAALFPRRSPVKRPWLFPVVVIVLVGLGGLGAMMHLGRPQNVLNVLYNPTSSLTMEGMASGVLALVALIDAILCAKQKPSRVIRVVGAVVSVILLCIITYAYTSSFGNPAWSAAPTYLIFVLMGLSTGMSVWYCACSEDNKRETLALSVVAALATIVLVWQGCVFVACEASGAPLIFIGAVVEAAVAVAAFLAGRGKLSAATQYKLVAILAVVALIVSRYGFYMASII